MTTIAELLACSRQLEQLSETPRLDAEILLGHVLNADRSYLYTWPEREVGDKQQQAFKGLLSRRERGEPIAHITGRREFWSLNLKVTAATLVPRPETELLVEATLATLDTPNARVLDLGTGSGAVALALAREKPDWSVAAVDIVPDAVQLAVENALLNGIGNLAIFESDWFSNIDIRESGPFDAIVSNPPYIAPDDPHLGEGDVRFEPVSALVSDNQGMADLERLIRQSFDYLAPGGWLLLEHGHQQGRKVRELLGNSGYTSINTIKDLAGRDRVSLARRGEQ